MFVAVSTLSAGELDELSCLRESSALEKGKREAALVRSPWKPDEFTELADLVAVTKSEWEVRANLSMLGGDAHITAFLLVFRLLAVRQHRILATHRCAVSVGIQ